MNDNRRKLTGILKLLYENTDAEHSMDTYQIMDALESMGYGRPDRKTIDSNIKYIIEDLGMGIRKEKGKPNRYRWVEREFDLAELKMLVDAVYSSRFITKRKSREIIAKLKDLTSVHQASTLNRELYMSNSFKNDGSDVMANTDLINEAIKTGHRLRFTLACYDIDKNEVLRDDGKVYEVSPFGLVWNNDFFYMVGSPAGTEEVCSYRLDQMRDTVITKTEAVAKPNDLSLDKYSSCIFDMTSGDTIDVVLKCKAYTMGSIIDRFGKNFYSEEISDDTFSAKLTVDASPAFYAWLFQFGGDIQIVEPESAREGFKKLLNKNLIY
ncbi:MAG: WYL domain-containing protein [Mogibacterium sp.]|nr:WYL domain-containing protein [Mogibacterium sp.]